MTIRSVATTLTYSVLILALLCRPATAQSTHAPAVPDREAVLAVVQAFFDTMTAKDVAGAQRDFWRDGAFSHCGIDAFDLIKTEEGWKIGGGAYTVETECKASPLGPLKE